MDRPEDKRRQREFDDLQNERADRDTGRVRRFFPEENRKAEQRKRDERLRSRLAELLADPLYATAYEEAGEAIAAAQAAADAALLRTAEAIERLTRQLETLERRASRLHGEAVFLGADGRYRRADGGILSDDEAALVERAENPPSYETYLQNADALHAAQERRDRILHIQSDVIDPARDRWQDEGNPMSVDELDGITNSLKDATTAMNDDVSRAFVAATSLAAAPPEQEINFPPPILDIPAFR